MDSLPSEKSEQITLYGRMGKEEKVIIFTEALAIVILLDLLMGYSQLVNIFE
jgi:hypothetical protein